MGENAGQSCHNVDHCPGYDPRTKQGAPTHNPFCEPCLDRHERDIRALLFDYLDLAQLHEPALSQAINPRVGGSTEAPLPLSGHAEELQAEILHVATTWETELRAVHALSHGHLLPAPAWATTRSHPLPAVRLRGGAALQRALRIVLPRLRLLARLPAVTVLPTGVEDEPADVEGWEAVQHLASLHTRARAMLGRTTRRFWIPGECWACGAHPSRSADGPLYRSEPRFPEDPMQVDCDRCHASRAYPDYERYMATLLWPESTNEHVPA